MNEHPQNLGAKSTDNAYPRWPLPLPQFPDSVSPWQSLRSIGHCMARGIPRTVLEEMDLVHDSGPHRVLFPTSEEALRDIMVTHARHIEPHAAQFRVLGARASRLETIPTTTGELWSELRKTAAPFFKPSIANDAAATVDRLFDELIEKQSLPVGAEWKYSLKDPIANRFRDLLLGAISHQFLGVGTVDHLREILLAFETLIRTHGITRWDVLMPAGLPTPMDLRRRLAQRGMRREARRFIAVREAVEREKGNFNDLFAAYSALEDQRGSSVARKRHNLTSYIIELVVAGSLTSSDTLKWALFCLARDTHACARIAEEADRVAKDPADFDLARIPFTTAFLSEVLRVYPAFWNFSRIAVRDISVAGKPMPKGSIMLVAPGIVHRHRRVWDAPDEFDPTRFLNEKGVPVRNKFQYLPFGAGPRICIGRFFAYPVLTTILLRVARDFRIELLSEPNPEVTANFNVQPSAPLSFRLLSRIAHV